MSDTSKLAEALLNCESGIAPNRAAYYEDNWDRKVLSYWEVERPGRCRRDRHGDMLPVQISIREFFASIGLAHVKPPLTSELLRELRFQVINPLGFVGFQFGEHALWDLGYYEPRRVSLELTPTVDAPPEVPCLYVGSVPGIVWQEGRRLATFSLEDRQTIVATDTNEWLGMFTGKNGVGKFQDLLSQRAQLSIFNELAELNLKKLSDIARANNSEQLLAVLRHEGASSKPRQALLVSRSGLIAACHLVGPNAVAAYFLSNKISRDEVGTSVEDYLVRFSGYGHPDRYLATEPESKPTTC